MRSQCLQILIVDDHPIVRQGLFLFLGQEVDFEVCGEAETACQALELVAAERPDIAVVDISLPDMNGLELIKRLKEEAPAMPTLVLSMHDETLYAERALRAGAKGYLMKQEAPGRVVQAIRRVMHGELALSDTMNAKLLHQFVTGQAPVLASPLEQLSDRELEVLQLIGQGIGTRAIATKLHLSVKTIETHREHIKKKLQIKTAPGLLLHALQWEQSGELASA